MTTLKNQTAFNSERKQVSEREGETDKKRAQLTAH